MALAEQVRRSAERQASAGISAPSARDQQLAPAVPAELHFVQNPNGSSMVLGTNTTTMYSAVSSSATYHAQHTERSVELRGEYRGASGSVSFATARDKVAAGAHIIEGHAGNLPSMFALVEDAQGNKQLQAAWNPLLLAEANAVEKLWGNAPNGNAILPK